MLLNQKILAFAALACSFGCIAPVHAAPITYTLASNGTGTFGGTAFTNALVTVKLTGNTSAVTTEGPGLFNPGTATVTVAGLGTATLTDTIGIFATFNDLTLFGSPAVVILDLSNPSDPASGTGILGQIGAELMGYNLQTAFGPDTGSGGPFSGSKVTPHFATTGGDLTWAIGQSLGSSTFTAAISTPEPETLLILGAGLILLAARVRRPHSLNADR